ncbi:RagB/SusD domain-containing protein (plasmid) [Gemmatirosa kalamazoonensis]|uniref:RagB/SusD domain-containing protein n=1 Tax=Gemmatirosa kalamazoonensis TaxID=861299 RepID=W0RRK1_9BACT|nr:RagB/SusD family nutrient uptake outer membrane protein [Gemmatirosa kalamazoonensis]AHG93619.1 RagB/SusD domain-containing protein [Gemmatirosa kalamazoonensis]
MRTHHIERALALLATLGVVACKDVTALKQTNPGQVSAATLYVPQNAQLLVNGAIADFECAYTRYVVGSGLLVDELSNAIGSTANFDYDARRLTTNASYGTGACGNNQQPPIYTTLSTARGSADTVLARLKEWTDAQMPPGVNRTKLIGQAAAYAGYSLVLLGEGMCTAAINLGPELTPDQVFAEAKARFDEAVTAATAANDQATLNLALLGRARTLLDMKQPATAAADAAKIPASFIATTGTDNVNVRRQNFSFLAVNQNNWATVDPSFRGLTLPNGAADPRVAVTNTTKAGTAQGSVIWTPDKYPTLTTVMPIARWAEAQLIIAEARAAAGDIPGAVAAINAVRATRTGVPAYDATGQTAAQVQAQIVEERRRELFLEGHRLGDIRRLGLALSPAAGTAYAGGGGTYGTLTCFPLPDVERVNNPNIAGKTG